jgi:glycosyltransferase involved in cell wall biosynthesis
MNILLSIHHELDGSTGAPGVTVKLAKALQRRGHDVRTLSFDDLGWASGPLLKKVTFPWLVFFHVLRHPEYDVLDLSSGDGWIVNTARRLAGWRKRQLSITRSHGLEHMGHELFIKGCRDGLATKSWKYPLYWGGYRLWECRQSFHFADVSLVLNEAERQYALTRFNVDVGQTEKIGNGIDECFAQIAQRLLRDAPSCTDEPVNVAFAGRAVFWKGFSYLAEAMTGILTRHPAVKLGLFGTGGTVESVLSAFPAEVRDRISVVPRYENEALPELLAGFQIFAFPSLTEGFGIAPLEAMACGLVPIVADIAGPREYMHDGRNGVVVPPRDARALETAIAGLIEDRDRWLELRRNALATAIRYSWAEIAARHELFYCQRRQRRSLARA